MKEFLSKYFVKNHDEEKQIKYIQIGFKLR